MAGFILPYLELAQMIFVNGPKSYLLALLVSWLLSQ